LQILLPSLEESTKKGYHRKDRKILIK